MHYTIKQATIQDAIKIAPLLRPADRAECIALSGLEPEVQLPMSVLSCIDGKTIFVEGERGEPLLIGGVSRSSPCSAWVWMMGTPDLLRYRVSFLREGIKMVDEWNEKFPLLHNYADGRNTKHLHWLRWLGFKIISYHKFPHLDFEVAEFVRTKECVPYQP